MNIEENLDRLDALIDGATGVPLTGKIFVESNDLIAIVKDLRDNMPQEIAQARKIVAERQHMMEETQKQLEAKVKIAEERARRLVDEDEITKKVKQRVNDMMSNANAQSKELKVAANEFADNILKTTEQGLIDAVNQVRNAKTALRSPAQKIN